MKRAIDLRGAVAINVITMIGIGPLVTIPLVLAALGGPLALVGWIAGAVVALCDGLVWAELSSRFPGSGGTYVYLRETFGATKLGRGLAFLFNWQFLLYAPCLLASGYIGFANYAAYLFPAIGNNVVAHDAVAVGAGLVTILLLFRQTSRVAAVGTILAFAAIATLALVAIAGLTHANFAQAFHLDAPVHFGVGLLAGFGSALVITLYDYSGYSDAALLGDEVIAPERTIPRSIVLSVLIVAAFYVLLQIGILGAMPWHSLLDAHNNPTAASQYVGSTVVAASWGYWPAVAVTLLVLVTAFASVYGNLLGFSRVSFAAARDGTFLRAFAALDERKQIPHVALFAVGGLSLIASLFTLDQVILILTAGIVLVQGIAQIIALAAVRLRRSPAPPYRMPLYPLPAIVALAGWSIAFVATGEPFILLAVGWLAVGAVVFLVTARIERWWPFAALLAVAMLCPAYARAADASGWSTWNTARVVPDHGYPVFTVDGKPFFVYGAAFFYERIPREQWRSALASYKQMGINTIDLYVIWNWHEPSEGVHDFTGSTNPRRDFVGLLNLTHELGFKLILRPGPVIRNEWRNGGYPAWLLQRPEYNMPEHDVLEGRYPATATYQNAHADAAADEWLHNATHLAQSARWLHEVLQTAAPFSHDVLAIALDDDQGAYIDNDTWPAPHWHTYIDWLAATVRATVGNAVPLLINTFEMKVTASAPVWAWGDWYQSDAYRIGSHDLTQLDFATGLLQTQPNVPVMLSEFQAGWLQGADEAAPRPSDASNTALALHELLRDGAHGVVNFPVQDTIYPDGWEAPWANWSYAWDAALTADLYQAPRYAPTVAFGDQVTRYGPALARTHRVADAAIIWPPSLFAPSEIPNADFGAFADATTAMQQQCDARHLTCDLIDLRYADETTLRRYGTLVMPIVITPRLTRALLPSMKARLAALSADKRVLHALSGVAFHPALGALRDATLLLADDGSYAFIDAINPSDVPRVLAPPKIRLTGGTVTVPAIALAPRSATLVPVGIARPAPQSLTTGVGWHRDIPISVAPGRAQIYRSQLFPGGGDDIVLTNDYLRVAFAPDAGARISLFEGTGDRHNRATSIGLLRDAVDPEPSPSARDYIAAYTHPLPAGTFNRPYACTLVPAGAQANAACTYAAPDLPDGGARFQRTLALDPRSNVLVVSQHYAATDPASAALPASISGFTFLPGDTLIAPPGAPFVGFLHAGHLVWLAWRPGDIDHAIVRPTRDAQIVTLVFAQADVQLRLGAAKVADAAEAERLLRATRANVDGSDRSG